MNDALDRLNDADSVDAVSMFRNCCGSDRWAESMTKARPFKSESALIETAESIWNSLDVEDWLEAFAAHPKIGENKAAPAQQSQSASWSAREQAGVNAADEQLREELADANREYYEKFGFIFIVCATGRSGEEMLELCRRRLLNDRQTEIKNAGAEQKKITEIRLKKLLSS